MVFHISFSNAMKTNDRQATESLWKELRQLDQKSSFSAMKIKDMSDGQIKKAIRSHVFFKEKYLPSGEFDKFKARLVAGRHMQDKSIYEPNSCNRICIHHCNDCCQGEKESRHRRHRRRLPTRTFQPR